MKSNHCELYLERIKELGGSFAAPIAGARSHTLDSQPYRVLVGDGVTLEQANLDFTLMCRTHSRRRRFEAPVSFSACTTMKFAMYAWPVDGYSADGHGSDLNAG